MHDEFIRIAVPFASDYSIWEGMIDGTLYRLIALTCCAWGLAAISLAVNFWSADRLGNQLRNP